MARRRIGQEQLALADAERGSGSAERGSGSAERGSGSSLDEVAALVDWAEVDRLLAGISASPKGEPG